MKELLKTLESHGALINNRYKIGKIEIDSSGYVFNCFPSHFIGHINSVEELKDICEYYNEKKLEHYKN